MKDYVKRYVKHQCGHAMVAATNMQTITCKCGYKFSITRSSMSAERDQPVEFNEFPTALEKTLRINKAGEKISISAGVDLVDFNFNIGRSTNKLLDEIKRLAPNTWISKELKDACLDGRTRTTTINISYYHSGTVQMECWISLFNRYGKSPNNKLINERLIAFRDDMKLLLQEQKKPENWYDKKTVVVETATEYQY